MKLKQRHVKNFENFIVNLKNPNEDINGIKDKPKLKPEPDKTTDEENEPENRIENLKKEFEKITNG
jgi:hypothetical protein